MFETLYDIVRLNPAFKLLIIFSCGLLIFEFSGVNLSIVIALAGICILLCILNKYRRIAYLAGVFALAGITIYQIKSSEIDIGDRILPDTKALFIGEVDKILSKNDKYIRLKAHGKLDLKYAPPVDDCGIFLNLYKLEETSGLLRAGNKIYIPVKVNLPSSKVFSTDFDEKSYARYNDVQFYASGNAELLAILDNSENFNQFSKDISQSLANRIDSIFAESVSGVVKAIVLGDKSDIDIDTRQAFSLSGTAHVLAVSGLHVGIIAGIISLFLAFFENRILKFTVFTILIVIYAAITGFCPSVLRAGFMAILINFVYTIDRKPEPINIFSFAVFMLIIFSPTLLYSPGFQMSVGSIAGIIMLYSIFRNSMMQIIKHKSSIIKYIINSLAVTFSASIAVSPLVAYYFGVYSIISPLTNLIILPLMSLALIYSVISIVLSFICFPVGIWFGASTNFLIWLCLKINTFAVSLPDSFIIHDNIVLISIVFSLALLYVLSSNNVRKFYFRLSSVLLIGLIAYFRLDFSSPKAVYTVYPLKNIAVAEIETAPNTFFYYIADRKNKQYPIYDFKLYKYLKDKADKNCKITLGLTGNVGMATYDKLKKEIKLQAIDLSFAEQYAFEKELKLPARLPQIISKIEKY